jgi:hypothetical protein
MDDELSDSMPALVRDTGDFRPLVRDHDHNTGRFLE